MWCSPIDPARHRSSAMQDGAENLQAGRFVSRRCMSCDTASPVLPPIDAVANANMKLIASDQAQSQLRDQRRDGSVVWDEITSL